MRISAALSMFLAVGMFVPVGTGAKAAEPSWIFGVHDTGGYSKIEQAGKRGWLVVTMAIGHDPSNTSGSDFRSYSNRGHGVIVRLNNGYGSDGTLPYQSQYANFATRCANYVAATQGADIFIIGNETNLPREWPGNVEGNPSTGEPITVSRYLDCYNRCYNAIKAVRSTAQVCPTPVGTWAPPFSAQGIEAFDDYWVNILNGLGGSKVDALMLHAYTHGCDPTLVTSDAKMGYPYSDIYYNFRVYRNYMSMIPVDMRDKPVYITECDQNVECADPPPTPRHTWYDVNNNWVEEIYREIDNWNKVDANQKIRCVALFRWDDVAEGEWNFGFSNRSNVVADWLEAMQNDYRWDAYLKGTISGYVKDVSNQPIAGATVMTSPGGYSAVSGGDGAYTIANVLPGTYSVTASKTGFASQTQANKVVGPGETITVSFSLAPIPVLDVTAVTCAQTEVLRGEAGVPVSITLANNGLEDLQVEQAYPVFMHDGIDVSGFYSAAPSASNGRIVPRGGSLTLGFAVDVHPDAPFGATTVDAYVEAWPNIVPNGSFEEGGETVPPTHWFNWSNQPTMGCSWDYDTSYKVLGARSYKLGLTNTPNSVFCTANTGSDADLLPVQPSTQYYNSVKERGTAEIGSPSMMLVFQEYDASKAQISYDHYHYFTASAAWEEIGAYYTTAANAAYARVWLGLRSGGSTTAALWVDDVQLRPVGFSYTDTSAQTPHLWTTIASVQTIAEAKQYQDTAYVSLADKTITARFDSCFYIEEDDRSSGVRVEGVLAAEPGSKVGVTGMLLTNSGERTIAPTWISPATPAAPLSPLGFSNLALGGAAFNEHTPGVHQGLGTHNLGLLATAWGKVTYADSACFYIDDGTGLQDGSGHTGVRVSIDEPGPGETVTAPAVDEFVRVTGISTTADVGGSFVRCIRVRSQGDIYP